MRLFVNGTLAPKGQNMIAQGKQDASCASVCAALGTVAPTPQALKG